MHGADKQGIQDDPKERESMRSATVDTSGSDGRQTTVPAAKTGTEVSKVRYPLAGKIVEHKSMVFVTTALTIYALTGDDCRLIFTNKPADPIFDWIVVICILVFFVEVMLSCIGKDDYLGGFFFYLDVISTASLVLDISTISDLLANGGGDGEDNAGNMRSGRTARLGAKLGRIMRVLRLVRILKLYKAYYEEKARRRKKEKEKEAGEKKPGEDDEWDDSELQENEERQQGGEESQVGKKLSELTTRKTICLILAMLLALPLLRSEAVDQVATSTEYGADMVWQNFEVYFTNNTAKFPGVDSKDLYDQQLIQYVHYHNWFARANPSVFCPEYARDGESCADMYYGHIFWVGLQGDHRQMIEDALPYAPPELSAFTTWETAQSEGIYNLGTLPKKVKKRLSQPWNSVCDSNNKVRRGVSLLKEAIEPELTHTVECPQELRVQEVMKYSPRLINSTQYDSWHMAFYFDVRPFVRWEAIYSLLVVAFILVLLILGSLLFAHDANRLIVHPVEKMIRNVKLIRANPLVATQMADEEYKQEEIAKARLKRMSKDKMMMLLQDVVACKFLNRKPDAPMETLILEKTIIKLGSLLALGFGEAGANIIRHNMTGPNSAMVNAMVSGTTVECIIGSCRVRDFSVATEVLQSQINKFVNMIAEIIHGVADEFHGAPNRNNGDTFLVIWRVDHSQKSLAQRMADMSIVAFAKILGAVHRSPVLAGYRTHPGLQYRLGTGCRVNLSFGVHAGWAIEGAVGSEFKIDASYLSPHVSIATSIERATSLYNVSVIVAQSVVDACSATMGEKCRLMDRLRVRGSADPMMIYSVDLDWRMVNVDDNKPLGISWGARNRFKARQFLETEKNNKLEEEVSLSTVFDTDLVIATMRKRYTVEFFQLFNMGYQNYHEGEWQVARRMLMCTRSILGIEDGPSCALISFMEGYQFEVPSWWEGVRDLPVNSLEGGISN